MISSASSTNLGSFKQIGESRVYSGTVPIDIPTAMFSKESPRAGHGWSQCYQHQNLVTPVNDVDI